MKLVKFFLVLAGLTFATVGCQPAEEAASDAASAVQDGVDNVEDAANDAADAVEGAVDDAVDAVSGDDEE